MRRMLAGGLSAVLALAAVGVLLATAGHARAAAGQALAQDPPPPQLLPLPISPQPEAAGTGSLSLLLVPDGTNDRVMAFDPASGDLVNPNFIPSDTVHLSSPIDVILSASGNSLLVSDSTLDVVQAFDFHGGYQGVFAPAGGANTTVLDNPIGIALRPNGNLLAASSAATGTNAVAQFDAAGNSLGGFIANGAGGVSSPYDIFLRPGVDWLVSSTGSDGVLRYNVTTGAYITGLAAVNGFPEQIALAGNGNVLVANFSGTQAGIVELTAAGALVGVRTAPGLSQYRGVYELPNLNLLVATGLGVYEIDRAGQLVETKISGVDARYIERVEVPSLQLEKTVGTNPAACGSAGSLMVPFSTTVTYCYTVRNTGNLTLTRHTIVDSQFGTLQSDLAYVLAPGASAFLTKSALITTTTVNTATWTAYNPGSPPSNVVSATSVVTVTTQGPAVSLVKTVGLDPATCATTDPLTVTAGTQVIYCYSIRNTGGLTLTRHTLFDDHIGTILNNFAYTLGIGSGAYLTLSVVITDTTVNLATWTSYNPGPVNAANSSDQARVAVLKWLYFPMVQR